jgi:phosphatidylglycerophosphatase A
MSFGDRLRFLLITSCGLGLSPFAPGTVGTLGGVIVGVSIQAIAGDSCELWWWVAAIVLFALGCMQTDFVKRTFPNEDPGAFVLDEVVGYLVTIGVVHLEVEVPVAVDGANPGRVLCGIVQSITKLPRSVFAKNLTYSIKYFIVY